ncbi:MAG: tetratricopeptide repeat protein [Elusimicrobia bacterium]|nr:tetratricopeptide repeat protein [Elusimicrobiota bacterium]
MRKNSVFLLACISVSFAVLSHCVEITRTKYTSYSHYLQGLVHLRDGNLTKAQYEFERTIEHDTNAVAAYRELILIYLQTGRIEKARALANIFSGLADNLETKLFLGTFYVIINDTTSAINVYDEVLKEQPDNKDAILTLASIYNQIDPEKALYYWDSYIKFSPDESEAYYRKALTLIKLKKNNEAEELLKSAIKNKPEDVLLHLTLSELYEHQKQFVPAAEELHRTAQLEPNNHVLHMRAGGLYFLAGEHAKAEESFRKAIEIAPRESSAFFWLAILYEEKKLWHEAIQYIRKSIDLQPDVVSYLRLSYYYTQVKDAPKAIDTLQRALKKDAKSPEIHFFLGLGYMDIKRYKKAESHLLECIKLNPQLSEAYFYLGVIYDQTKKFDKAVTHFRKAIKLNPKNSTAMNYLGYSFAERGMELDEAAELIESALEMEPENGAYLDSLGWVYFKKGDYVKAKKYLLEAAAKLEDPVVYEHMGDIETALGNDGPAQQWYRKALTLDPENKKLKRKIN